MEQANEIIGKIIEGYRIIKFLGSGKFSVVGNCLTCKNNVELSKFSSDIKTLIEQYKLSVSDVQFYYGAFVLRKDYEYPIFVSLEKEDQIDKIFDNQNSDILFIIAVR